MEGKVVFGKAGRRLRPDHGQISTSTAAINLKNIDSWMKDYNTVYPQSWLGY